MGKGSTTKIVRWHVETSLPGFNKALPTSIEGLRVIGNKPYLGAVTVLSVQPHCLDDLNDSVLLEAEDWDVCCTTT